MGHLTSFDHFNSFDIVQPRCKYGDDNTKCIHYLRMLQNDYESTNKRTLFEDRNHLLLYCHSPIANDIIDEIDKNYKFYDCTQWVQRTSSVRDEMELAWDKIATESFGSNMLFIPKLVAEVTKNGYINELLPKTDVNPMFGDKKYILTKMKSIIDQRFDVLRCKNIESLEIQQYWTFCSNAFRIFDMVEAKMNHPSPKT